MNFLQNIFSGGTSKLIDSIGNALDNNLTTKEEKLQLELEDKKAEYNYQAQMKGLEVEETKAFLADTSSARDMNTRTNESANASKLAKNIASYLAIGATILTFGLFAVIILKKFDPQTKDIIIYLLGALTTIVTQIFSFYFGSSQGSKDKSDIIKSTFNQ